MDLFDKLTEKKKQLDAHHPLPTALVDNLQAWFRIELTYTSNAIEGNTLSRAQTALVADKGITIEGKTLREQIEVVNHIRALEYIYKLQHLSKQDLTQNTILQIHGHILAHINDQYAGRYRDIPVRIAGSSVVMPNPLKVAKLMDEFMAWLHGTNDHAVRIALDAHYKLVSIHPFVDGNGRTARLVMNLLLLQAGYPPAIIQNEERNAYIASLEKAQLGGPLQDYYALMAQAVERSLDVYLDALQPKDIEPKDSSVKPLPPVLKIGELAKMSGESVPTIRYWTQQGLLQPVRYTAGHYSLYSPTAIEQVKHIRYLQQHERLSIVEIKARLRR